MSLAGYSMNRTSTFAQVVAAIAGASYVLAGIGLLLAPEWFFSTIGPFGTFNRHYMGDAGSFLLPIGLGLLFAALDPSRYLPLLALGAGASVLHALNHLYDAVVDRAPVERWLLDVGPLVLLAALLVVAVGQIVMRKT